MGPMEDRVDAGGLERAGSAPARSMVVRAGGFAAVLGVAVFTFVVVSLHVLQPRYDPANQLMSELALGRHGWAMFFAFAAIATALAGLQFAIAALGAGNGLRILMMISAALFLAAGVFPLGEATSTIHISAIAAAFVTAVLAMYLFPSMSGNAAELKSKAVSWSMAAGVAVSVAMGQSALPMGIAQRLAAAFLLLWILVMGSKLLRTKAA